MLPQEAAALAHLKENIDKEIANKAELILSDLPEPIATPEAINEVREELQAKAQEEATTAWTETKAKIEEDAKAKYREGKVG